MDQQHALQADLDLGIRFFFWGGLTVLRMHLTPCLVPTHTRRVLNKTQKLTRQNVLKIPDVYLKPPELYNKPPGGTAKPPLIVPYTPPKMYHNPPPPEMYQTPPPGMYQKTPQNVPINPPECTKKPPPNTKEAPKIYQKTPRTTPKMYQKTPRGGFSGTFRGFFWYILAGGGGGLGTFCARIFFSTKWGFFLVFTNSTWANGACWQGLTP